MHFYTTFLSLLTLKLFLKDCFSSKPNIFNFYTAHTCLIFWISFVMVYKDSNRFFLIVIPNHLISFLNEFFSKSTLPILTIPDIIIHIKVHTVFESLNFKNYDFVFLGRKNDCWFTIQILLLRLSLDHFPIKRTSHWARFLCIRYRHKT